MTEYGWDASHYDGQLTRAILARAKMEGIAFFHHKLGEGLADTEGSHDDTALAAARDAGIPLLGGYLVPRTTAPVAAQVDRWLALANAGEPWWRSFPGWYWVIDLERWDYDNVPAAVGIAAGNKLRQYTDRQVLLYASHGQYGAGLEDWDGPLINADYTSRPAAGFEAMYPGDDWQPLHGTWRGGWAPYSGKTPALLQYTSSATIAGLTTCDANAFRGSSSELAALITRGTAMSDYGSYGPPRKPAIWEDRTPDVATVDVWCGEMERPSAWDGTAHTPRHERLMRIETALGEVRDGVRALRDRPDAVVVLTDAQIAALAGQVAGQVAGEIGAAVEALTGKVDQLLARLSAAGDALGG